MLSEAQACTYQTAAEQHDEGFCRVKNYDDFQQCGTTGLNGYSFCQVSTEGSKLCFENFCCTEAFARTCSVHSDCGTGYTCAANACGTTCTPQCGLDLRSYGSHYKYPGECWDENESRHLSNARSSPLAQHAPCTPGSGAVDAANLFHCDETTSTLVYRK